MNFGTWNLLSLYRPGASSHAVKELEKQNMDITAVQEIRWPGNGTQRVGNSILLYSGNDQGRHQFGTGFIVRESIAKTIMEFKPINEHLCYMRLKGEWYNYSVVSAHAPTEEKDEEIKDTFYDELENLILSIPKYDMLIILGDFNAKVGKEEAYQTTIGKHSLHDTSNDNGTRLVDLATSHNLLIKSTMFEHKNIHKETWISNDGFTRNQIDHVIIDRRHGSNCLDVRSLRGADADTDHFLVRTKIRIRISTCPTPKKETRTIWDTGKLKTEETQERYQEQINEQIKEPQDENSIDELWANIEEAIATVSKQVLGKKKNQRRKWFDDDCNRTLEARNLARKKMLQHPTAPNIEEYRHQRTAARRMVKRKKREYQLSIIREIEENRQNNRTKEYYSEISKQKAGYQPREENFLTKNNGELITNEKEILNTWKKYFCELLNDEENTNTPPTNIPTAEIEIQPPSYEETVKAIKKLKNNKASGSDGIPAECIKSGGETLHKAIHKLIQIIWRTEALPDGWKEGVIVPIHKKGDKKKCTNYRGITLLNTCYKILSNILLERMKPYTEEIVGDYQCGFRSNRSTVDQIFTIRQIMEKCWEFDRELHQMFIDFKQAFDRVCRSKLWQAMQELGFPKKLISLTKVCMEDTRCKVRVGQSLSDSFSINNGLKQGDALSPQLFNIALEYVVRNSKIEKPTAIFHREGPNLLLAFADDVDVIGNSRINLKDSFIRFEKEAERMGLKINEDKTKYMYLSRNNRNRDRVGQNFSIGDYNFERTRQFKYLGTSISENNDITEEINNRIQAANRCLFALQNLIKSRILTRKTKLNIYKTIVRPVVIYGCETWTLTVANEERLKVFERKVLRKIFGPTRDENTGQYRIKTNQELKELHTDTSIINEIKARRLQWAGHVKRMPDDRMVKLVWEEVPGGKRPLGRPRLRWRDNITKDLKAMKIEDGPDRMLDREGWRRVVESAKTHPGL